MLQMNSEGSQLENSLLLERGWSFALFRPSTDWTRPTHIMKGNLLCSIKMLNSFKNTLTETPRIMFDQISGHPVAKPS